MKIQKYQYLYVSRMDMTLHMLRRQLEMYINIIMVWKKKNSFLQVQQNFRKLQAEPGIRK
mgnify:CR=1 FL=1